MLASVRQNCAFWSAKAMLSEAFPHVIGTWGPLSRLSPSASTQFGAAAVAAAGTVDPVCAVIIIPTNVITAIILINDCVEKSGSELAE